MKTGGGNPAGGALRTGVAVLALAASFACTEAPPLAPAEPVRRLGESAGGAKFGGVSRPVVAGESGEPWGVDLTNLPASRLVLAAAASPGGDGRDEPAAGNTLRCRAELRRGSEAPLQVAEFAVPADGSRWAEAQARLPAVRAGRLVLTCGAAGAGTRVTWAQPLLVAAEAREPAALIVLMSLDTLRADYVAGFGGPAKLTPRLERLGRRGLRMLATTAESTWTLPSHYALFFSRLYGFPVEAPPVVSLTEALAERGFATFGLTGGGFMGSAFHFHRGFDAYAEYASGEDELPAVLADAVERIERLEAAPTFLYVHSYAVHELPPREREFHERAGPFVIFRPTLPDAVYSKAFYAGLVNRTDAQLGPFLAALERAAAKRPVLLVLISDHGEAFFEHENFRHGVGTAAHETWRDRSITLHDEVIHVPLLVWSPRLVPPGRGSQRPTMLGDVAPTLLAAAGAPVPASMRGANLWPLWSGEEEGVAAPSRESVSHTPGSWSLRGQRYKLLTSLHPDGERVFELYDLAADPGETNDLAARQPERVRALTDRLRQRIAELGVDPGSSDLPVCPRCRMLQAGEFWQGALGAEGGADAAGAIDEETRERLRDLGYVE